MSTERQRNREGDRPGPRDDPTWGGSPKKQALKWNINQNQKPKQILHQTQLIWFSLSFDHDKLWHLPWLLYWTNIFNQIDNDHNFEIHIYLDLDLDLWLDLDLDLDLHLHLHWLQEYDLWFNLAHSCKSSLPRMLSKVSVQLRKVNIQVAGWKLN